jgi:hypothetical protein
MVEVAPQRSRSLVVRSFTIISLLPFRAIIFEYLHKTFWKWFPKFALESNGLAINNGALISSVTLIPRFTNVTLDPSSTTARYL